LGGFPVLDVVAFGALVAELSFVRIVVAGGAIWGEAEVGFRQVVILDEGFFRWRHVCGRVAFFAGDIGVLALQRVAGEAVIKFCRRRFPVDDVEIFAVVFEVAANAILASGIIHPKLEMVAVFGGEGLGDFLVAIETLEGRSAAAELVTGIALGGAAQRGVRFGERAGRNLRTGNSGEEQTRRHGEPCKKNCTTQHRRRAEGMAVAERAVGHAFLRVGSGVKAPLPGFQRLGWALFDY